MGPPYAYRTQPDEGTIRVLIVALLFVTPAIIPILASIPVRDPDVWWHLATGKWILEHGRVPTLEPFSLAGDGRPWVAYSWLYEVLIYGLYERLGLTGLFVYSVSASLAVTAALYALIRRQGAGFLMTTVLVALTLVTTWRHQGVRTFLLTILFFTIELDLLLAVRKSGRSVLLLLLPPLFLVWANVHIQFVYGLLVLALAVFESCLERVRPPGPFEIEREGFSTPWIVTVAVLSLAATLVTPYGLQIYVVVYEYVTQGAPWLYLRELRAPDFRSPLEWIVLSMALAGAFALGRQRQLRLFPALLLLGCALLSFRALRDTWCVAIVAAAFCAQAMREDRAAFDIAPFGNESLGLSIRRGAACAAIMLTLITGAYTLKDVSNRSLADAVSEKFPVAAVHHVQEQGYAGPLYNHFDWGGYLIWALPEMRVSMDGRTNVYGDKLIERSMNTWDGALDWGEDPALGRANLVIAGSKTTLASLLRSAPEFEGVFEDDVAAVFVRRDGVASDASSPSPSRDLL